MTCWSEVTNGRYCQDYFEWDASINPLCWNEKGSNIVNGSYCCSAMQACRPDYVLLYEVIYYFQTITIHPIGITVI